MDNKAVVRLMLPWLLLDTIGIALMLPGLLVLVPDAPLLDLPAALAWALVLVGGMMVLFAVIKVTLLAIANRDVLSR